MKLSYILIIVLYILPLHTNATDDIWSKTGHRVVGEIANDYLTGKTRQAINEILNGQSLAFASTFADEIKSDSRYNEFYTWHYINMPMEMDYEDSKKNPEGDLVFGIEYCVKIIKDKKSTNEDKAFYLKLLIHFIGDLHQPLHIGLEEDRGGNDFKVQWFYQDSNLHKVWDSQMIEDYNMSYTELAKNADILSVDEIKAIEKGTIIDWVNETHQLTREVYKNVKPDDNLRYRYSYENLTTVRTQLQKAGIRLAKVLNNLF